MQNKKRKRNLRQQIPLHPSDSSKDSAIENNYSIAERGGKVKETRGFRPVFQSR